MNIKKVGLFIKEDAKSQKTKVLVQKKLESNGFIVTEEDYDMAIAIGGDGTFLRMVKDNHFNSDILYVGINTGTLGFLQEIKLEEIDLFIKEIINNDYKVEEIGIQTTTINHQENISKFYSLNEIVVRDDNLKTVRLAVKIDNKLLENFIGDGLLITTSVGSTAQNLSYRGSIVYNTFSSLQITPLAPINSKVYRSLLNSVIIPDKMLISLEPKDSRNEFIVTIDGENNHFIDIKEIKTTIDSKRIKCIRLSKYNFIEKINEKLLAD